MPTHKFQVGGVTVYLTQPEEPTMTESTPTAVPAPTAQSSSASTATYWISIGRGVGDRPLVWGQWHGFKSEIRALVHRSDILTEVEGSSTWEGVPEDTHLFLVSIPASSVDDVRHGLARIARAFNQEAIGFVGGPGSDTLIVSA